jgi:hypothetical protein
MKGPKGEKKADRFKFLMNQKKREQGKEFNRKLVRAQIRAHMYLNGEQAKAPYAGIASRKERRQRNKDLGIPFNPVYNGPVFTYKELHGVGYERFNSKYVKFGG